MDYIKEISHLNDWEKRTRMSIDATISAAYMLKTISKDECYKKLVGLLWELEKIQNVKNKL
ncbi:MAG: hypothetical protein SPJ69_00855 [Campylobacter sp.]|uniref:hypothetical protein n=1 Tax=Campylobacter sp. TaxID=205 RepID=UPI002978E422|nr:hypothetical protein [Campylobacter sp.]MDD7599832.1 hypothetical protein [Campylobacteraceae bacterium]MDY5886848.1 hypothetical protein [Campylobacter sp.]